ncbi:MAG: hypothetical protein KDI06_05720 [Calditrichaeota bacterium]|nr:hypothetical protein [Calditrichota bacterium]HQU71519.1 DUF5723 family protein [Calditrichia bacterium]
MKGFNRLFALLLSLTLLPLAAQQTFDARGTGMAFSNSADTRGLEQTGLNPATLALHYRAGFEFNFVSLNASVYNNSLNKGLYDQYFTTGDTLQSADKENLLNHIPGSGLQSDVLGRINTFGFYLPNFSLTVAGVGASRVNLPREVAELALYGNNELGRVYDFSNVAGDAWGGMVVSAGLAIPFRYGQDSFLEMLAVGITGKYISGLAYFEVTDAQGSFTNPTATDTYIDLDGELTARTARGGSGMAFDLGLVAQTSEKFTLSATLLNGFGRVNWQADTEIRQYTVSGQDLAIGSDGFEDSLIVDTDTTYATGAFTTHLPVVLDLGLAYKPFRRLTLTANMEQGFTEEMGGYKGTRVATGLEFTGIPLLPLRAGASFGGRFGNSYAFGTGLYLKILYVDLAVMSHGGFSAGSSQGLTLAATTRLSF